MSYLQTQTFFKNTTVFYLKTIWYSIAPLDLFLLKSPTRGQKWATGWSSRLRQNLLWIHQYTYFRPHVSSFHDRFSYIIESFLKVRKISQNKNCLWMILVHQKKCLHQCVKGRVVFDNCMNEFDDGQSMPWQCWIIFRNVFADLVGGHNMNWTASVVFVSQI